MTKDDITPQLKMTGISQDRTYRLQTFKDNSRSHVLSHMKKNLLCFSCSIHVSSDGRKTFWNVMPYHWDGGSQHSFIMSGAIYLTIQCNIPDMNPQQCSQNLKSQIPVTDSQLQEYKRYIIDSNHSPLLVVADRCRPISCSGTRPSCTLQGSSLRTCQTWHQEFHLVKKIFPLHFIPPNFLETASKVFPFPLFHQLTWKEVLTWWLCNGDLHTGLWLTPHSNKSGTVGPKIHNKV